MLHNHPLKLLRDCSTSAPPPFLCHGNEPLPNYDRFLSHVCVKSPPHSPSGSLFDHFVRTDPFQFATVVLHWQQHQHLVTYLKSPFLWSPVIEGLLTLPSLTLTVLHQVTHLLQVVLHLQNIGSYRCLCLFCCVLS